MIHKECEIENAKKELQNYKHLQTRKKQLFDLIINLQHEIISAKSPIIDPSLIGGNSSLSSKISYLADLKDEYEKIIIDINVKINEIEKILMKVAEEQVLGANILHYKFIDNRTLEEISLLIGYSYPQTFRIYNSALKLFYKNFKVEVRQYAMSNS